MKFLDAHKKMIRLTEDQCRATEGLLPASTLSFLREVGVPQVLEFRLIDHAFNLDLEPLLNGEIFRVGFVDRGWYAMGIQRATGSFGYVFDQSQQDPWCFVNSSLECFFRCFEASDQMRWDGCGTSLEEAIRLIDPVVFADPDNIWSFLVEECHHGDV